MKPLGTPLLRRLGLPLLLSFAAPLPATAGVLLDHGTPDFITWGPSDRGSDSVQPLPTELGQQFSTPVAGGDLQIAKLRFWGGYLWGSNQLVPDSFTVRLYGNDFDQPLQTLVLSPADLQRSSLPVGSIDWFGLDGLPLDLAIYAYEAKLAFTLSADSSYLLSIQNYTPNDPGFWIWAGATGEVGSPIALLRTGDLQQLWPMEMAFQLLGAEEPHAVPEPGSVSLLALGLALLMLAPHGNRRRP